MRFTMRGVLVLTTFCALLFAWWTDHNRLIRRIAELEEQKESEFVVVGWEANRNTLYKSSRGQNTESIGGETTILP